MNADILSDRAPCSPYVNRPAARWLPARLIFDPEDGGDTFLRNFGSHTDDGATYQKMVTFGYLSHCVNATNP
jgi:hypothetical protein